MDAQNAQISRELVLMVLFSLFFFFQCFHSSFRTRSSSRPLTPKHAHEDAYRPGPYSYDSVDPAASLCQVPTRLPSRAEPDRFESSSERWHHGTGFLSLSRALIDVYTPPSLNVLRGDHQNGRIAGASSQFRPSACIVNVSFRVAIYSRQKARLIGYGSAAAAQLLGEMLKSQQQLRVNPINLFWIEHTQLVIPILDEIKTAGPARVNESSKSLFQTIWQTIILAMDISVLCGFQTYKNHAYVAPKLHTYDKISNTYV